MTLLLMHSYAKIYFTRNQYSDDRSQLFTSFLYRSVWRCVSLNPLLIRVLLKLLNEKTLVRFFFLLLLHIFVSTLKYYKHLKYTHYYNHGVNSIFTHAVLAVPDGRTRWKRRRFVVVSIVVFSYVRRQKRFQFDFERRRRIWKTFFEESFFRASRARGERTRRRRTDGETTTTTGTARVDDVVAHERLAESHVERSVRR